jgi:hypothetical protein
LFRLYIIKGAFDEEGLSNWWRWFYWEKCR